MEKIRKTDIRTKEKEVNQHAAEVASQLADLPNEELKEVLKKTDITPEGLGAILENWPHKKEEEGI
jgi:DNA-directed RNA polymerase subunit H (RpoH/RPB5)